MDAFEGERRASTAFWRACCRGLGPRALGLLRRPPARRGDGPRHTRSRADHLARCGGRVRSRGRRPRRVCPHVHPRGLPTGRGGGTGPRRARGLLRTGRHGRDRPGRRQPLGPHGRARAGQGGGRVDRARPRPDPAVDLGPPHLIGTGTHHRVPVAGRGRRDLPAHELAVVPGRRRDLPAFRRRPVVAGGHRRGPGPARLLLPRRRLAVGRRGARLRPLHGLGPAPVPGAVGADERRGGARGREVAAGRGQARPLPGRRPRPGGRERVAADRGPQPELPVRRGGAVLGGCPRRGAVELAGPAPARGERGRRPLRRGRRAGRRRRAHPGLAPRVACARAGVLRAGLTVLGGQGATRRGASGRAPGVVGRRRAAARRGRRHAPGHPSPRLAGVRHQGRRHRPRHQPRNRSRFPRRAHRRLAAVRAARLLDGHQPPA